MKGIRNISRIIFGFTWLFSLIYGIAALYCLILLSMKSLFPSMESLPVAIKEYEFGGLIKERIEIYIPFSDYPLFFMKNTTWSWIELVLGIGLYALFFFLLSNVFHVFRGSKLFTSAAIQAFKRFAYANLLLPPLFYVFLLLHPSYEVGTGETVILILHLLLGLFAWFQAKIFQEGFTLQREIDLTI